MCDVDAQYARKIKMPMNKENKLYARMASEAKMKGLLLKDIGMAALNEIRTLKNKVLTRINRLQFVQTLKREYRRRPDIGILVLI